MLLGNDGASAGVVVPATGLDDGLRRLLDSIDRSPTAAAALAMLLRHVDSRSVTDALESESLLYSVLQAGPEFLGRLQSLRRPASTPDLDRPISVRREADELVITLIRRHVHNALNREMRDALIEALSIAVLDSSIHSVVIDAEGPSFCSGGDLSEFGTLPNPATAHLVRTTRSLPRLMALLHERLTVRLHGACIGAGIELAAFAGHVMAAPGTYFELPELAFGLIPGSGGTVSIPARIGRHRAAWLALSGTRIGVADAVRWGLVDRVDPLV